MMKPRGANAWWTAAIVLALVCVGVAYGDFDLAQPRGWAVLALAVAAIGSGILAFRIGRR